MDALSRSLRNGLVSDLLARESLKRESGDWVAGALSQSTTMVVPVKGEECLFRTVPHTRAALFPAGEVADFIEQDELTFLGHHAGSDYFAVPVASGFMALFGINKLRHIWKGDQNY